MADWTAVERCRKPTGIGKRHLLALLGFCGFALSYAMRFSLSIAIVAMVNSNGAVNGKIREINSATSSASPVLGTPEFHQNRNTFQSHSPFFKSDICPHDTTPHSTLDLRLNLYHVQTNYIDRESSSFTSRPNNINNVTDKNGYSIEVVTSHNGTKNSSLPTTTTTAYNEGRSHNKYFGMPIAEPTGLPSTTTNAEKKATQSQHVEDFDQQQGEFFWNEKEQGIILGSFFWGYVLTQAFGGWISQKMGGKWPFGIGLLITGLFAIVTPTAARVGGMPALIVVRIIQGLAGGVTVPSMQAILSKWFPPEERGKLGSFTLAGMPFGTFISTLCSGFLIYYFGWSSVFYVTGIMTLIWFVLWSCFAHASPFDDPTIDEAELQYIKEALKLQGSEKKCNKAPGGDSDDDCQKQQQKKQAVPWSRVLLSLPFWAILVCNTCETWGLYTINAELPTYMKTVLHFDIKQNSVMSAFPHLLTLIVSVILTNVGDTLIEHQYLSIGCVRKLSTSIAMWGYAAALLGVAYSGCDRVKTVALLATAIGANGGKFGGFLVNIIDIAPNYSGILMGVINTVASLPGFFAPWIAGMIINDNPSLENWRLVFIITASVAFFGNLVYILCASGIEQSWNRDDDDDDVGTSKSCCCGSPSADDKTLQSATHSSLDCINQKTLLNKTTNQLNSNKQEWENNGVYIIPLDPPVEALERNHHQQDEHPHHPALPPFPIVGFRNVHQQHQEDVDQELDEQGGLRCSA